MNNVKSRILNTAFECLSEHGFANVSMRDIAKESGVALSQVTYYYGTKENLLLEVIDMMIEEYTAEFEQSAAALGGRKQKLGALIAYFKELIKTRPKLLKLFVDLTAQAMWVPSFREKIDSMFKKLAAIIQTGITGDEESEAKLIFGALYGTSVQILLENSAEKEYELLSKASSLLV